MPTHKLIADLAAALESARSSATQKIVFFAGNGINNYPDTEWMKDRAGVQEAYRTRNGREPSDEDLLHYAWRCYEFVRFVSANFAPPYAYFLINECVAHGIARAIITTNYDLFFESTLDRCNTPYVRNPGRPAAIGSYDGYYGNHRSRSTPLWKVHGSLSHATFLPCVNSLAATHAFALPHFPVSNDLANFLSEFPVRACHFSRPADSISACTVNDLQPTEAIARHYIDWTYQNARQVFAHEIDRAKQELEHPHTGALVVIGFTGYNSYVSADPRNEELAKSILEFSQNRPVFWLLHSEQYKALSTESSSEYEAGHLYRHLGPSPHTGYEDAPGSCLADALDQAGIADGQSLRRQYKTWETKPGLFASRALLT